MLVKTSVVVEAEVVELDPGSIWRVREIPNGNPDARGPSVYVFLADGLFHCTEHMAQPRDGYCVHIRARHAYEQALRNEYARG